MIKQKIINTLCKNPEWYNTIFAYSQYREFQILCKEHKFKISKSEKEEIRNYWNKYYKNVNLYPHTLYYNLNGIKDVRYIPDHLYYRYIDPYFNNMKYNEAFEDKNYYDMWFKDLKRPNTIIHNIGGIFYNDNYEIISNKDAYDLVKKAFKKQNELIIKPTVDTNSGKNVKVINKDVNILELFDKYRSNFIIQELVKQHKELQKSHKESLNTIRVMSLLWKNEVVILGAVHRMGRGEARVDNSNMGGIHVGINPDGSLMETAYDHKINKYTTHPSGFVFKDGKIPNYEKLIETVKKAHQKFGYFKLIHWDFSIDETGEPVLIEVNIGKGGIFLLQYARGPLFGDLTEEILEEIFIKQKKD